MNAPAVRADRRAAPGGIAITGGKGGVGKSNLAVNLAVALGRWERRVLLVDGDLGLANVDVLLGLIPERTVEHLLEGEACLEDLLVQGPAGVQVLPAASGIPRLHRLDARQRDRLRACLSEAQARHDDLLIDTGAGLGGTTLALQRAAARVIVVTTPEPTSLVDAYATLKVLWTSQPDRRIDLVVNEAADREEAQRVFEQISRASREFLASEPALLGEVPYDPHVEEAVRRQRSVVDLYPAAPASAAYERIALRLTTGGCADAPEYWDRLLLQQPDPGRVN